MRLKALIISTLVSLACLLSPTASFAWTQIDGVADPLTAKMYRDWEAASQIPTAHVTVGIAERECSEAGSVACLQRFTPVRMTLVYPDPSWLWREADSPERITDRLSMQAIFYHELGHVRDYQHRRSHHYRARFAEIMRWHDYEGWDVCVQTAVGCIDPGEWFAQASTWCSLNTRNRTLDEWASGYGYAPNLAQHRATCTLLSSVLT